MKKLIKKIVEYFQQNQSIRDITIFSCYLLSIATGIGINNFVPNKNLILFYCIPLLCLASSLFLLYITVSASCKNGMPKLTKTIFVIVVISLVMLYLLRYTVW